MNTLTTKPRLSTHKFRIEKTMPEDMVNLAYINIPTLTPEECIKIFRGPEIYGETRGLMEEDTIIQNADTPKSRRIEVFLPGNIKNRYLPWYIRIRHGFFRKPYLITGEYELETDLNILKQAFGSDIVGKIVYLYYSNHIQFIKAKNDEMYREHITEVAEILNEHKFRVINSPICLYNSPIEVTCNDVPITTTITDIEAETGIFTTRYSLNLMDTVQVFYYQETDWYEYTGYTEGTEFKWLDLNPTYGHTGRDLLGKIVHLYMRPYCIEYGSSTIQPDPLQQVRWTLNENKFRKPGYLSGTSIYGTATYGSSTYGGVFEPNPDYDPLSVLLARVAIVPNILAKDIKIIDTRSRGGGLKENISTTELLKYKDADSFWDIGRFDGEPYTENSVVVLKLTKETLNKYSEREIKEYARQFLPAGAVLLIDGEE